MAPNDNFDLAIRIGRLEGEMSGVRTELAAVKEQNAELLEAMSNLREEYAKAQGGVKVVLAIGSVVAACGAVIAWGVNMYLKLTGHN